MDKHLSYFNLLDALGEEGCPICSLLKKTSDKFRADFLYEQVNDPKVRQEVRASLGFCNACSWEFRNSGDAFGISIIYQDLLGLVSENIKKISEAGHSAAKTLNLFLKEIQEKLKRDNCLVCKARLEAEKRYVSTFLKNFSEPEFYSAFKNSFGLCLPHLIAVIRDCRNEDMRNKILAIEQRKIDSLVQELSEFQRKHDYRFSEENFGSEKDSWVRAIEKMVGKENLT